MLTRTNATRQYFDRTKDINLIHILTFMQVLFACRSPLVVSIVRSMIISIAYLLDTSLPVWAEASTDALIDCPVPVAHKRSRRIDPSLKRAIGHAIAQRVGGATAGKMHQTLSRFRKWGAKRFGVEICSNAVGGRVRSYIRNAKKRCINNVMYQYLWMELKCRVKTHCIVHYMLLGLNKQCGYLRRS